ncbi:MAG: TetR/AcrR family transcriptional regulator [Acidimicrobiales bacterium]
MGNPVKRSYNSALRRQQAAQTRARILEAAGALFEANGYGPTAIRHIADAAGVAVDTVYATFGSKARVLTALVDARLAPAGEPNVTERPEALAVRDEPDQRRQLRLFARDIANISARVRPIFEILRTASAVEPEIAPIYAEMEGYRARNMRQAAEWIAARGKLRVPVERAAEIIWVLASPDVARLVCEGRGWSNGAYAHWLEDTLVRTLLPDPPRAAKKTPSPITRPRPR